MNGEQDSYVNDLGQDRRDYFDDSSSSGWVCKECCALVAARPEFAFGHMAWHDKLKRELSDRPKLY